METKQYEQFQTNLTRRLLAWSGISIASGLVMALLPGRFWRGVGHQFLGWGLIDGAIALLGMKGIQRRQQKQLAIPSALVDSDKEARTLAAVLAVNTALDVGYVAGGAQTIARKGREDLYWRGAGWGIILQGGFLFFFDLIHYLILRRIRKGTR